MQLKFIWGYTKPIKFSNGVNFFSKYRRPILFSIFYLLLPFLVFAAEGSSSGGSSGVAAGGLVQCGNGGPESMCTLCSFFETGHRALQFLVVDLATPAAVIFIIAGGFMMLVAGGNESVVAKGRQSITYAVIGIVIILAAWIVVNTILFTLANQNAFPWPWNQIHCS